MNCLISNGSLLLPDGPEIHLHPKRIDVLSDVLGCISGNIGVKVVLATHSPQLLQASETECHADFMDMSAYTDGSDAKVSDVSGYLTPIHQRTADGPDIAKQGYGGG